MLQTFDVTCMFKENIANPLFAGKIYDNILLT